MSETGEIGPTDQSPEASTKRFEARQKHRESTKGQVASAARHAEQLLDEEQKRQEASPEPDIVEEKRFLGIPITKVRKWFKK